jgi:hypothetical protein
MICYAEKGPVSLKNSWLHHPSACKVQLSAIKLPAPAPPAAELTLQLGYHFSLELISKKNSYHSI